MKANGFIFHFSNMANESSEERQIVIKSFLDIPQPFFVGHIVTIQPSEREIYLEQIEPCDLTPCILSYPTVEEYIYIESNTKRRMTLAIFEWGNTSYIYTWNYNMDRNNM